jgi:taurine dioxygenase
MSTTSPVDIEVRPLSGSIGAEVLGVSLANLDDRMWSRLRELWLEHLVLFFPAQHLAPDDHISFGRRLGEPEIHPFIPKLDEDHSEIVVLSSQVGAKADVWHTDVTFSSTPPLASILSMAICPLVGGDTIWTNQYVAYEQLAAPVRDMIDGLTAVHTAEVYGHPEMSATHPVVRVHPETGRRSLFVNRTFTSHIVEMSGIESDALLEMLCSWSQRPEFQCRYQWAEGAVGWWDNRCTQHYAINDFVGAREIHRVTILGDEPAGDDPRWEPFSNPTGSVAEAIRVTRPAVETDSRTNSV